MKLAWFMAATALVATPALAQQGAGGLAMLEAADANHDGSITRAEAQAGRGVMFERLDADHDGFLSEAERTAASARGGGQGRRGLEGADTDNDGRISRAELTNLPFRGFDRLDRNHNDVVSADELEAARNLMQGR